MLYDLARSADEPVPVLRLERRSRVRSVTAEGYLKAVETTPVTAPGEGERSLKIAWLAADGGRVEVGAVIVRFDPTEIETELSAGLDDEDIAAHRLAKAASGRSSTLRGLARDAEVARREMAGAGEFESRDPAIFSRKEILESRLDTELARRRLEHAEAVQTARDRLSAVEIELLELEKRKAALQAAKAKGALAALEVRAPHAGLLVLERDWGGEPLRVGEVVWPGQKLAEIPRPGRIEAEVYVLEADAGGLAVGQAATFVVEAAPERVWRATVARVDNLARPRLRQQPVQYFAAALVPEGIDPAAMKPGQRVAARIVLEELTEALAVPRQAVFEKDGRSVVYRGTGSGFEAVEVTLGASALGWWRWRMASPRGRRSRCAIRRCRSRTSCPPRRLSPPRRRRRRPRHEPAGGA